jgi:hypothetical protein
VSNTDLYVYYRVRGEQADALQSRVLAMQAALAVECGVATSLKRRPEEKEGRHTWMEVYLAVPPGFDALLQQRAQGQLADLIDGSRHVEYFMDCSTCA